MAALMAAIIMLAAGCGPRVVLYGTVVKARGTGTVAEIITPFYSPS